MRAHIDLPLVVDRSSPVPLAVQVGGQLREAMRTGALKDGERLPSTRGLAALLGVSRTVVTDAYQQLYAEGWLDGRHGSGTYVAEGTSGHPEGPAVGAVPAARTVPASRPRPDGLIDLRPGRPWVHDHDRAAWRRAWRSAGDLPLDDAPDPYGRPELRELLAEHLRRARAVPVGAGDVMVTRGTGNGLDLIAATLLGPGARAGVEEPGYRKARTVFAGRGAQIVPCPVDDQGVIVEALPDDLRVLYTTPAHQYPVGGRLPIPRRERLLAWARRTGAMIVEDDYDAEFRYDVAPLPALYGLDPARVVLLGTLSKSLSPDVGVGWLVAAGPLLDRVARRREELTDRTPGPVQAAVATMLARGDLDRHLRRTRLEYARRRAAIVEALGPLVHGDTAGLHVMIEVPAAALPGLVERARERGVLLDATDRHHHGPPRVHGLVLGYGSVSLADVRRGCEVIRELISPVPGA
ncbi:MocR-like pyridoxine biosynthesis transcription factor PdxR [Microbispora sp. ATCC PTA-5024]|uniref:MocR-like pyridoxine biosynthesis transcription factor PdxR n=1 Tax=Microbispora sp. ATCC PTA-5024 TaxID=316330 RepID=UPI0003DBA141|nr:PLP-dependent aminotransferase family protein [Microbispora sp. ATCC PTA-5024]ETK31569.1 GntR family transcriptional regulator [Microbispora sp. ATCC PTA-5024]